MKNLRVRDILIIVANLVLIAAEVLGLRMSMIEDGMIDFRFYTELANAFSLIAAIVYIVFMLISVFREKEIPKFVSLLKYASVISLAVTMIIVAVVLAPFYDNAYGVLLFSGSYFFYHTLAPLIALISFIFIEEHDIKGIIDNLIGISPTVLYGVVMTILNIAKVIQGPYPFLMVYKNTLGMSIIWFAGIIGGTFLLAELLEFVSSKGKKVIK